MDSYKYFTLDNYTICVFSSHIDIIKDDNYVATMQHDNHNIDNICYYDFHCYNNILYFQYEIDIGNNQIEQHIFIYDLFAEKQVKYMHRYPDNLVHFCIDKHGEPYYILREQEVIIVENGQMATTTKHHKSRYIQ